MGSSSAVIREQAVAAAVPLRGWASPAPVPLTPLIGRRTELADAIGTLRRRATRLLTLTGPGGIGKTRLALELAVELERDFDGGIVWVPLATVRDPDTVMSVIAASVGIAGAAVDDRLVRSLRDNRLLFILDNFEHLIEAAPRVAGLLAACPMVQAVVTSRSRLRVRGERVLPVPPLSLRHEPGGGNKVSDESSHTSPLTLHSEAVTLFIERAQALVPDIEFNEANAAVVVEICQRLDGLPLAIELAASRVGHLPLRSLLDRMERRLPLLVGGDRDLPDRLQTMRHAIAWSYDLLAPAEQFLFRCLAVFDGGIRIEAVEEVLTAVCATPGPGNAAIGPADLSLSVEHSVLDLLASLVDKSLVRLEPDTAGAPRYSMLETVREFASEQLAMVGMKTITRQAHADSFLALAEREALAAFSSDGELRLDALEAERPNMRAALLWWLESGQAHRCLTHAAALGGFWYARSHLREGQEWLARSLEKSEQVSSPERARALAWLGLILFLRGEMKEAEHRSAEVLALCQALGDVRSDEYLVSGPAPAVFARSQRLLTESLALYTIGVATFHRGDPAGAAARFLEGCAAAEAIPDARLASLMIAKHTRSLGIVAGEQGEFDEASRYYAEALRRFRYVDDKPGIRRTLGDLAYLSLQRGNDADALERLKESLGQSSTGPVSVAVYDDLLVAAIAAAHLKRSERATQCLAATEALRERLGLDAFLPSERSAWAASVAAVRRALGEPAFTQAWATGRGLQVEQAIAKLLAIPARPPAAAGRIALSARELEVLRLLVAGQSDRAIGTTLSISHRTVEFHVSRILAKLGVSNRGGAVAAALAEGLVAPPTAHRLQS